MFSTSDHISEIQKKVNAVLGKLDFLKKENLGLKQKLESSQQQITDLQNIQAELKNQNLILKSALNQLDEESKKELNKKLAQYIKTIDQTIAQLSK